MVISHRSLYRELISKWIIHSNNLYEFSQEKSANCYNKRNSRNYIDWNSWIASHFITLKKDRPHFDDLAWGGPMFQQQNHVSIYLSFYCRKSIVENNLNWYTINWQSIITIKVYIISLRAPLLGHGNYEIIFVGSVVCDLISVQHATHTLIHVVVFVSLFILLLLLLSISKRSSGTIYHVTGFQSISFLFEIGPIWHFEFNIFNNLIPLNWFDQLTYTLTHDGVVCSRD